MLDVTALYGVLSQKSRGEKTKAYSKMAVQQQDAHFIKNQANVRCHVRYHKVYLYCHTQQLIVIWALPTHSKPNLTLMQCRAECERCTLLCSKVVCATQKVQGVTIIKFWH